ncbi:MAG: SH3 domain-containing protein, partial [Candidatus Micrarchaeaceae archaeon]
MRNKKLKIFVFILLFIFFSSIVYQNDQLIGSFSISTISSMNIPSINNISKIIEITANLLNVRSGPGTNYSILGQVSKNSQFYAFQFAYGTNVYGNSIWYNIYWNGGTGWISSYYTKIPSLSAADTGNAVEIKVSTLNVRSGPGTNYNILGTVHQNQIYVLASHGSFPDSSGNPWFEIYYNNQSYGFTGFIYAFYTYGISLPFFSVQHVQSLNQFSNQNITVKKVFMPYLYPNYNGYANDFATYGSFMSGIQYEQYYLSSSLTLGNWGDGGVGSVADQYNIPKWPMIVNNYNVTRTQNFLNNLNAQTAFINAAIQDAINNNYAGYSIDFEGTNGYTLQDAQNYVNFLNNFADALHLHGMKLAVAPQPAYNSNPNSLLDYYLYNPNEPIHVDYIMPQCYEGYFSTNYPYDFIGAVNSILNAVGNYLSINQIIILLMTTNPNTNSYFTPQEMNERIYYIESKGINGIGIWSMDQPGGFPQSQYLWGQLIDFEFSGSEWNTYKIQYSNGANNWLVSLQSNNIITFQILGTNGSNVPLNGTASFSYISYMPLNGINFNFSAFLPPSVTVNLYGLDQNGNKVWTYPISSNNQYIIKVPDQYTIYGFLLEAET